MPFGTIGTLDRLFNTDGSIDDLGEARAWEEISTLIAAHNREMNELVSTLAEFTTTREFKWGSSTTKRMQELDEYARPDAQRIAPSGQNMGFPLRKYGDALQWTRNFFQQVGSARRVAAEIQAMVDADRRQMIFLIKKAMFRPTNYTFNDRLIDDYDLPVKALINADSSIMPLGPNGEVFAGATHTHYLKTAGVTLAAADMKAGIDTVREHYNLRGLRAYINLASETTVRGFTGFAAYTDARLIQPGGSTTTTAGAGLDLFSPNDRAIGLYDVAEVWVKPWMPAGYVLFIGEGLTPLAIRERQPGSRNLGLVYDDETHPLRARGYEREVGIAVRDRTAAAVLYIDTGAGGVYVEPTLTYV